MGLPDTITIGELASRSGVSTSALRFYDAEGLIRAGRSTGGQRRFDRSTLRRVAFIVAAQRVGLSLLEIRAALDGLPADRTPDRQDWARLSRRWHARLDAQIADLERLRDDLSKCIGCGCLSLSRCSLYNRDDLMESNGPGAHYLLGAPRIPRPMRRRG